MCDDLYMVLDVACDEKIPLILQLERGGGENSTTRDFSQSGRTTQLATRKLDVYVKSFISFI